MSAVTTVVNSSDLDLRKREETKISNWMIAGALGAVAAVTVAGTIYYVKSQRKQELQRYRFGAEDQVVSAESYKQKVGRYWTFATSAFTAVQSVVADFLAPKKGVAKSPLLNSKTSAASKQFQSDQEVPDVLEDEAAF